MGDVVRPSGLSLNPVDAGGTTHKRGSRRHFFTSIPKALPWNAFCLMKSVKHPMVGRTAGRAALFLLELATLELIRRFSRAKCPVAWRGLQALQLLCYPPFKWIQKWPPFKGLVNGMQMLSRPLLVLSIGTVFSDNLKCNSVSSDFSEDSDAGGSRACSESCSELPSNHSTGPSDVNVSQNLASENWMVQLHRELENQGIPLPERINKDELYRFYQAANEDFTCLLSSIKKTIRWRETYHILSEQELSMWSTMVFWHGYDIKHQPFLIVRLGYACRSLPSHDRPRFAQAIVSHIEHGVMHLADARNPQITVLVDCEGLSPLKLPMHMMRSCSNLLQDHFPNRLGCLLVVHLPPVARIIAQTLMPVLKPVTRQKLRMVRAVEYRRVLSEYLTVVPSYLGGSCGCSGCSGIVAATSQGETMARHVHWGRGREPITDGGSSSDDEGVAPALLISDGGRWNRIVKAGLVGVLMLWVLASIIAGFYDA